ncbi:hypothetical protein CBM2608_P290010 [Cupriavidus taiwanensis]|nr:hypothetical protein CBM2608_P290010 [Cupriavidus taiwanensis]
MSGDATRQPALEPYEMPDRSEGGATFTVDAEEDTLLRSPARRHDLPAAVRGASTSSMAPGAPIDVLEKLAEDERLARCRWYCPYRRAPGRVQRVFERTLTARLGSYDFYICRPP